MPWNYVDVTHLDWETPLYVELGLSSDVAVEEVTRES